MLSHTPSVPQDLQCGASEDIVVVADGEVNSNTVVHGY